MTNRVWEKKGWLKDLPISNTLRNKKKPAGKVPKSSRKSHKNKGKIDTPNTHDYMYIDHHYMYIDYHYYDLYID